LRRKKQEIKIRNFIALSYCKKKKLHYQHQKSFIYKIKQLTPGVPTFESPVPPKRLRIFSKQAPMICQFIVRNTFGPPASNQEPHLRPV
jgi:hypothetical protein